MSEVTITPADLRGMISLKADLSATATQYALKKATGLALPDVRNAVASGDGAALWMAPDELLVLCPRDAVAQTLRQIASALGVAHHLAVDVSDARAVFLLTGEGARVREVLARLTPTDMHKESFPTGELRRTRLSQVPAAIWMTDTGAEVFAFRSVADYVQGLLENAAASPSVGHF